MRVNFAGFKYWRMGYRVEGSERPIAFGTYPNISLKEPEK
ncbi:Arm DNA-binding domain-containing protein [Undibacterium sp. RuRC25W]